MNEDCCKSQEINMSFEVIEDDSYLAKYLKNWVSGINSPITNTTIDELAKIMDSREDIPIIDLTDCDKRG